MTAIGISKYYQLVFVYIYQCEHSERIKEILNFNNIYIVYICTNENRVKNYTNNCDTSHECDALRERFVLSSSWYR